MGEMEVLDGRCAIMVPRSDTGVNVPLGRQWIVKVVNCDQFACMSRNIALWSGSRSSGTASVLLPEISLPAERELDFASGRRFCWCDSPITQVMSLKCSRVDNA